MKSLLALLKKWEGEKVNICQFESCIGFISNVEYFRTWCEIKGNDHWLVIDLGKDERLIYVKLDDMSGYEDLIGEILIHMQNGAELELSVA